MGHGRRIRTHPPHHYSSKLNRKLNLNFGKTIHTFQWIMGGTRMDEESDRVLHCIWIPNRNEMGVALLVVGMGMGGTRRISATESCWDWPVIANVQHLLNDLSVHVPCNVYSTTMDSAFEWLSHCFFLILDTLCILYVRALIKDGEWVSSNITGVVCIRMTPFYVSEGPANVLILEWSPS